MLCYCTAAVLECPSLENPPNGMVAVMDNVPGSVAMYICDSGYMLSAQGDRTCERVGERDTQWGGVPPTCTRTCKLKIYQKFRTVKKVWSNHTCVQFESTFTVSSRKLAEGEKVSHT